MTEFLNIDQEEAHFLFLIISTQFSITAILTYSYCKDEAISNRMPSFPLESPSEGLDITKHNKTNSRSSRAAGTQLVN